MENNSELIIYTTEDGLTKGFCVEIWGGDNK